MLLSLERESREEESSGCKGVAASAWFWHLSEVHFAFGSGNATDMSNTALESE